MTDDSLTSGPEGGLLLKVTKCAEHSDVVTKATHWINHFADSSVFTFSPTLLFFSFVFFVFLVLHPQHMEIPRLRVE